VFIVLFKYQNGTGVNSMKKVKPIIFATLAFAAVFGAGFGTGEHVTENQYASNEKDGTIIIASRDPGGA
jgi:hypothetical protein